MIHYIITGATSFIGVKLCQELIKAGERVTAICRERSSATAILPNEVEIISAEMSSYKNLDKEIHSGDVFVNLAWQGTAKGARDTIDLQKSNIEYTLDAISVATRIGCKLFVESGSQAEYGIIEGPITEESPCNPITEYGKAKYIVQQKGFELCKESGMKYLHLRIFSVFGETDHPATLVMSGLEKMIRNQPLDLSPCTNSWNYLYLNDAVEIIIRLCKHALADSNFSREIFNIASDDTRILKDFVLRMADLAQSKSELHFGALEPDKQVFLNPDISKTIKATDFRNFNKFDDVIRKILRRKRGNDNLLRRAIDMFLGHITNKFIRFCFVGCLNAAFGYGVYCLSIFAGAAIWIATLISNTLGVLWNFMTTGTLVFENKDKTLIWKFIACYIANYIINTSAVYAFSTVGISDYWSGLFSIPISSICSFLLLKHFVYKTK